MGPAPRAAQLDRMLRTPSSRPGLAAADGAGRRGRTAEQPASWQRWLEPAAQTFAFSPRVVLEAGERPLDDGNRDATQTLLEWTRHALRLIQKYQHNPLRATRGLAIVHAAMHDALVVAAADDPQSPPNRPPAARTARQASPSPTSTRTSRSCGSKDAASRSAMRGHVCAGPIRRSLRAGSPPENARQATPSGGRSPTAPIAGPDRRAGCAFAGTVARNAAVEHPHAAGIARRRVAAMVTRERRAVAAGPARIRLRALPRGYYREVYRVSQTLTPEQKRIANEWNLQAGSVTPPGVWNQKALELIEAARLEAPRAVRLLAALNVAMHDAGIACWRAKYRCVAGRVRSPVIRGACRCGFSTLRRHPAAARPTGLGTLDDIGRQPEIVLAAFLPERAREVNALAEEAAESRLYAGVHFRAGRRRRAARWDEESEPWWQGKVLGAPVAASAAPARHRSFARPDGAARRRRAHGDHHLLGPRWQVARRPTGVSATGRGPCRRASRRPRASSSVAAAAGVHAILPPAGPRPATDPSKDSFETAGHALARSMKNRAGTVLTGGIPESQAAVTSSLTAARDSARFAGGTNRRSSTTESRAPPPPGPPARGFSSCTR